MQGAEGWVKEPSSNASILYANLFQHCVARSQSERIILHPPFRAIFLKFIYIRRRDALVILKVLNVSPVVDPDGLIAHKCAIETVLPIACLV